MEHGQLKALISRGTQSTAIVQEILFIRKMVTPNLPLLQSRRDTWEYKTITFSGNTAAAPNHGTGEGFTLSGRIGAGTTLVVTRVTPSSTWLCSNSVWLAITLEFK